MRKDEIDKASDEITEKLKQRIKDSERMTIVMAPPGSGKTHLLVEVLAEATTQNLRVAVATPTNAQANEVCERLKDRFPAVPVVRYVSSNFTPEPGHTYTCTSNKDAVSALTSGVVVGTVAKWGFVDFRDEQPFDYLVIEDTIPWMPGGFGPADASDDGQDVGEWGDWKWREILKFFQEHGSDYRVDRYYTDFFGLNATWNWNGFVRRNG